MGGVLVAIMGGGVLVGIPGAVVGIDVLVGIPGAVVGVIVDVIAGVPVDDELDDESDVLGAGITGRLAHGPVTVVTLPAIQPVMP